VILCLCVEGLALVHNITPSGFKNPHIALLYNSVTPSGLIILFGNNHSEA